MNSTSKSYRGEESNRTLDLRLDVNAHDPRSDVAKMFALAKSAGKELNVTFALDGTSNGGSRKLKPTERCDTRFTPGLRAALSK